MPAAIVVLPYPCQYVHGSLLSVARYPMTLQMYKLFSDSQNLLSNFCLIYTESKTYIYYIYIADFQNLLSNF